jgi:transposase
MVLLAADGRTTTQIAPLVQRSPDTVARVLKRYHAAGAAGVPPRPRPGRPVAAPPAWGAELWRVIELDPHAVGVESANWTTGRLAAYLERATGHGASDETVRLWLHRADYVCKRPGWTLKRKAQEQPGWAGNG